MLYLQRQHPNLVKVFGAGSVFKLLQSNLHKTCMEGAFGHLRTLTDLNAEAGS